MVDDLKTGGRLLVAALRRHGVEHVFCVPGESYLAALDALYDTPEISLTVCRQEGGAAMMADACGKLTGRPGLCFVTRAPGASNAAAGVHIALQDSTPLILLIGQVGHDVTEREAFQEVDYRRMFGPLAKWVAEIDRPERIPELMSRAFYTAANGRKGPVVLALPEDMLVERAAERPSDAWRPVEAYPGATDLQRLSRLLAGAERPLTILGGSGWTQEACEAWQRFVVRFDLPVATSFRCQDRFDNNHSHYAGDIGIGINPELAARVRQADLLLVVGARLGEITTSGYTLVDIPRPAQTLVHVYPEAGELGRVYQPALPINAAMAAFAAALEDLQPAAVPTSGDWRRALRAGYEAWTVPSGMPGAVQLDQIVVWLREHLPANAILANGAGNATAWLHRFYRYRQLGSQLAPTSGSMGYAVPAAVAAARLHPDRTVVAFTGDGCFQMTGQELGTAVQYRVRVIFIVVNNAMFGTIRMHQERAYPGRVIGTDLVNPDFAALARAYGAHGEVVERTDQFAAAFERARQTGGPALIEVRIDPEAITPATTLSAIRQRAGRQSA